MHARSGRVSRPYFLFGELNAVFAQGSISLYRSILSPSLFPSIKSTPPVFFLLHPSWHNVVRECHLLTRVSAARSDPSRLRAYLFPRHPRRSIPRSVREPNSERRMGNDRLKLCRGRTNADGLALPFYRYNLPAEFQTGDACWRCVTLRCAALRCISRIPDAAGLNYTHVTVLNSATERTR